LNIVSIVVESIATYQLKIYYQNYLESGAITVTSENASYPKYRLYDRAQGLLFKGTSHPNPFEIKVDLGASGPYPGIDTLILGENHNLAGLTLALYYSDNGTDYTLITSWPATTGINRQSFTEIQHRHWLLSIAAPATDPEIGELFLTKYLAFERNPNLGYGYGKQKNISRLESKAGYAQKTKWGEMRNQRTYHLTKMEDLQRIDIETFEDAIDSIKNFYIEDLEGNLFFAEFPEPLPNFIAEPMDRWGLDFTIQEVLD
jgi:hypothetical protein